MNISIKLKGTDLVFNLEDKTVCVDYHEWEMEPVLNVRLREAEQNNCVILQGRICDKQEVLYYCARKIMSAYDGKGMHYMDILLYTNVSNTVMAGYSNRSLGHLNGNKEAEIHQVLNGKILELIIWEGKRYIQVFAKGEYVEIPANAFHCTYILEKNTDRKSVV